MEGLAVAKGATKDMVMKGLQEMARDYKSEYRNYQGKPDQIKKRSLRNKARRKLVKQGRVHKGDHMDVDHKKPLVKGGGNALSNLRVKTDNANRSFPRDRGAHMVTMKTAFHNG